MLVLARGCHQEIVIGGDIRIRIGEISGGRVKLLIEAPRSCPVHRQEVSEAAAQVRVVAATPG